MAGDRWFDRASRRRRFLVGVSGGADSVALLQMLVERGFRNLLVCHLDHRLRGRASTADARFVSRLAERLGLESECGRADVGARAEGEGVSLELAARGARHEFFADCAGRHRCRRVLLGHHADDQAETVLWNLLRGSHGLRGMAELQMISVGRRKLELHRPLLGYRREELRGYLRSRGLRWREDASNAEPITPRNRLRHEGLPLLGEIAGRDVVPTLARAAAAGTDLAEVAEWALGQARVTDPAGRLHLPTLRRLPAALQLAALHRFLADHEVPNLDRATIRRGLALLDPAGPAAVNLPGGRRLRRRGGRIMVDW